MISNAERIEVFQSAAIWQKIEQTAELFELQGADE
jgi:hypothetical protein